MTDETRDSPFPASGATVGASTGSYSGTSATGLGSDTAPSGPDYAGAAASQAHVTAHRMAQAAHDAVDRLEQALGSGSERMMDWQQEYGERARDRVRASPLAAVGIAFGVGIVFSRLFMR
ncbi:MAG: hypothetical protein RIS88_322 [Pseudomonadota bacterium]|jgi:ElaB/YqjD/DUF883 family membrane-anchored ribosome-binding protein